MTIVDLEERIKYKEVLVAVRNGFGTPFGFFFYFYGVWRGKVVGIFGCEKSISILVPPCISSFIVSRIYTSRSILHKQSMLSQDACSQARRTSRVPR